MLQLKEFTLRARLWRARKQQIFIGTILENGSIVLAARSLGGMKANTLGIKMKIELKPTSNRFKRLINDFGKDWCFVANPHPMSCFNGEIGVTAFPANGVKKLSW